MSKGIDWDLEGCLKYNPQQGFTLDDIKQVLAVWEGENDGDDWRWILELNDGRFIFLQGGCDYTGWDCQSWAVSATANTPYQAAEYALGNIELSDSSPVDAGLGRVISVLTGTYGGNFKTVYDSLVAQLDSTKKETWTEAEQQELPEVVLSSAGNLINKLETELFDWHVVIENLDIWKGEKPVHDPEVVAEKLTGIIEENKKYNSAQERINKRYDAIDKRIRFQNTLPSISEEIELLKEYRAALDYVLGCFEEL